MDYPKLSLRADFRERLVQTDTRTQEKVENVKKKVKAKNEPIEDAWRRILAMKNTEADQERLLRVKAAMEAGEIGRSPDAMTKQFSKAEALRLYKEVQKAERQDLLEEMVKKTPENYVLVDSKPALDLLLAQMQKHELYAVDCETFGEDKAALDPWRGHMAGFTVSTAEYHFYVPLQHEEITPLLQQQTWQSVVQAVKPYLTQQGKKIIMHNAPFDAKWFYVYLGIDLINNIYADTRLLAFSMDENRSHRLKDLATDWLKIPSERFDTLFDEGNFHQVPLRYARTYGGKDGELTIRLFSFCEEWLGKREDLRRIKELVYETEMPVLRTMIRSDIRGITFDTEEAKQADAVLEKQENDLRAEIDALLGETLNLDSPAQLSKKLFAEMGLPDTQKGSTGSKVLKRIKSAHPVIPKILEYREVSKLRNSFTRKLPKEVKADGKIHQQTNTLGAVTGRKTCKNPKPLGRMPEMA